ncbi:MAG: branched-chain amino acid transport system II carrier protein [Deltaproteobacteria bacterium]|nr:branched-chain amino acid transport system II carrier protein [Deltaproteobacteria bacterium]
MNSQPTKSLLQTSLIVGFALFAMFFGAGNIIFPPYIGVVSGGSWFLGFIAYFFADIGLALLAILALLRSNTIDRFEGLMARLGYWPSRFLMLGVMFSIGFIAGPRTATVSFELGLKPIMGESANLAVYSGLYFFIAWLLTVKESKMVDYIGKYLTPTLVGGLIIMIVIGIVNPIGEVSPAAQIDNVWYMGLMSGYQTLDAVAALAFAFVISQDLANKGYATPESKFKAVVASSLVVGVLMFIVYGGLCYLGATASMTYGANVEHGSLVVTLFQALIGQSGAIVLGIIVTLACLTTGMALMGAPATFLVRLSNGRLKYNVLVTMLAFAYAIIANIGLSNILAIAVPVILILYPAVLVMVVLSLFDSSIKNANIFKISVGFALIFSVLEVMKSQGVEAAGIIEVLPLQEHGFGWILPAALGAVIGFFVKPAAE